MSLNEVSQVVGLVGSVITFIGVIFLIYKQFADPDIKAANKIGLLEQGCKLTHANLDQRFTSINKDISAISKTLTLLQENDIKHIELRMTDFDKSFVKLFTIMDERLPSKKD